jgi:glutathione-regulated potassium-efflux system ancillary protein KefC
LEFQWIGVAFVLGFMAKRLGQPPLIGFLAAGFGLELIAESQAVRAALGSAFELFGASRADVPELRPDASLKELANVGVLLLLFTIGLKLELRSILRPEVWGVTLLHAGLSTVFFGGLVLGVGALGVALFAGISVPMAMLIGFALSFSSTVLAVKVIEERDDMAALYGRVAIGILVVQDLAAVVFLAVSDGKVPSIWALGLLLLIPLRPVFHRMMASTGHGELLVLGGLATALGGAALFSLVHMKPDLGALVAGVLLGGHEKTKELAKSLLGLKDVFLVGFFLTVGLTGLPSLEIMGVALVLALLVPLKGLLYVWLLARFRLRARTSMVAGLALTNYSEFGLIVGGLAVAKGWLPTDWLVTLALALAFSFVLASPLNKQAFELYQRFRERITRWESSVRVPEEQPFDVGVAEVLIFGMGRVGTGAYDLSLSRVGEAVVGFDIDSDAIDAHTAAGRRVFRASATDADFWERLHIDRERVRAVMLAMSSHVESLVAIRLIRAEGFPGLLVASAHFADEMDELREAGADKVFHVMAEAGTGLAEHALDHLEAVETASSRLAPV